MKKWKIKGSDEFRDVLTSLKSDDKISTGYDGDSEKSFYGIIDGNLDLWDINGTYHLDYEEVTVEELKQLYYPSKDSISTNVNNITADYVKYVGETNAYYRIPNTVYKVHSKSQSGKISTVICNLVVGGFNPGAGLTIQGENYWVAATEAEYLAQVKSTSTTVVKWSVGTYVVFCKDFTSVCPIGYVDEITKSFNGDTCVQVKKYEGLDVRREEKGEVKWFATKQEAEDFAKTLTGTTNTEDFEIGDWVYAEKSEDDYRVSKYIPVFQVKGFNENKGNYLRPVKDESTGVHKRHCRKALPHEIPNIIADIPKKTEKEILLEQACKYYTVGTKFKSVCDNNRVREIQPYHEGDSLIWKVSSDLTEIRSDNGIKTFDEFCSNPTIYENGKWAEIVEETVKPLSMKEIQEECKRRFPIGCKFKSPTIGTTYTLYNKFNTYEIIGQHGINGGVDQSYLYYNGDYAELISLPESESVETVIPIEPSKSKYLIAAEKALKHFEDAGFYVGCEYEDTDGRVDTSTEPLSICESNTHNCYIDCGTGFLWEYETKNLELNVYGKLLIEDKPQSMEREFQVGDRVECIRKSHKISIGMQGTIVEVNINDLGVAFDTFTEGHSVSNKCDYGKGWLVSKDSVRLIGTSSSNTPTSQELNTYGLQVGDVLNVDVLNAWTVIEGNRSTNDKTEWHRGGGTFVGNRIIKSFHLIHGHVGFEVSDTGIVYLKAEGFKEFADNYYSKKSNKDYFEMFDIVECIQPRGPVKVGMQGVIREMNYKDKPNVGVQWFNFENGHDLDGILTSASGFRLDNNQVRLISRSSPLGYAYKSAVDYADRQGGMWAPLTKQDMYPYISGIDSYQPGNTGPKKSNQTNTEKLLTLPTNKIYVRKSKSIE
jgi:hypothetical protein